MKVSKGEGIPTGDGISPALGEKQSRILSEVSSLAALKLQFLEEPAGVDIPERAKIKPVASLLWEISLVTPAGAIEIRALVDLGADINIISAKLVAALDLTIIRILMTSSG